MSLYDEGLTTYRVPTWTLDRKAMTARAAIACRRAGIPEPDVTVGLSDDLLSVIALGHAGKCFGLIANPWAQSSSAPA